MKLGWRFWLCVGVFCTDLVFAGIDYALGATHAAQQMLYIAFFPVVGMAALYKMALLRRQFEAKEASAVSQKAKIDALRPR